jgi:hypothetical protein
VKRFGWILAAACLSGGPLFAAVTADSKFEKGVSGGQASPFSFVSTSGTVAGSVGSNTNRCLFGVVEFQDNNPGTVAMTWDSVSMTQLTSDTVGGVLSVFLFGLKGDTNVHTGAKTLSVSWTSGTTATVYLGAKSVYNCDGTTGWHNTTTANGTSTAPSITITLGAGDMAIAGHGNNNATSTAINSGTSDWIDTSFNTNAAQANNTSGTISWTLGSSVAWDIVGTAALASSGGGTTCAPTLMLLGVSQCGD